MDNQSQLRDKWLFHAQYEEFHHRESKVNANLNDGTCYGHVSMRYWHKDQRLKIEQQLRECNANRAIAIKDAKQ